MEVVSTTIAFYEAVQATLANETLSIVEGTPLCANGRHRTTIFSCCGDSES